MVDSPRTRRLSATEQATRRTSSVEHGLLGLKNHRPRNVNATFNPFDYEKRYAEDAYGEELSSNARLFRTFNDETEIFDAERVAAWKDNIDVLLVFAGLFSAVVAGFLVQSYQSLQPNSLEVLLTELVTIQRAMAMAQALPIESLTHATSEPFSPSTNAIIVNGLWFTSLTLSLTNALLAVLTKQWLYHYISSSSSASGTPRDRSRIRQYRFNGLEDWHVPMIIELLPFNLHIALALFLAGLVVFLVPINRGMAVLSGLISGLVYLFYLVSTVLPTLNPQCPYKTPLTSYLFRFFQPSFYYYSRSKDGPSWKSVVAGMSSRALTTVKRLQRWFRDWTSPYRPTSFHSAERLAVASLEAALDADIIGWLLGNTSNGSVSTIAGEAISALPLVDIPTSILRHLWVPVFAREFPRAMREEAFGKAGRLLRAHMHLASKGAPRVGELLPHEEEEGIVPEEICHTHRMTRLFEEPETSPAVYADVVMEYLTGGYRDVVLHPFIWTVLLRHTMDITSSTQDSTDRESMILALFQTLGPARASGFEISRATLTEAVGMDFRYWQSWAAEEADANPAVLAFNLLARLLECSCTTRLSPWRIPLEGHLAVLKEFRRRIQWDNARAATAIGRHIHQIVFPFLFKDTDEPFAGIQVSEDFRRGVLEEICDIITAPAFTDTHVYPWDTNSRLDLLVILTKSFESTPAVGMGSIIDNGAMMRNVVAVLCEGQKAVARATIPLIMQLAMVLEFYLEQCPGSAIALLSEVDGIIPVLAWLPPPTGTGTTLTPGYGAQVRLLRTYITMIVKLRMASSLPRSMDRLINTMHEPENLFLLSRAMVVQNLIPELRLLVAIMPMHPSWGGCVSRIVAICREEQAERSLDGYDEKGMWAAVGILKEQLQLEGPEYDVPDDVQEKDSAAMSQRRNRGWMGVARVFGRKRRTEGGETQTQTECV